MNTPPTDQSTESPKVSVAEAPELDLDNLKFDFKSYAQVLAMQIIRSDKAPLSICINGSWGRGKTTLLYAVKKMLSDQQAYQALLSASHVDSARAGHFVTVVFNAWKYSHTESLYVALIQQVFAAIADLETSAGVKQSRLERWIENLKQHWTNPLNDRYDLWRAMLNMVGARLGVKLDPADYLKPSKFRDNLPFYNEFEAVVKNILKKHLADQKRLVIFIDDLDRCSPEQTAAVLETIKTFLDMENCVFVVALDRSYAEACIKQAYGLEAPPPSFETWYLDKVLHITFNIPPLGSADTEVYFKEITKVLFLPDTQIENISLLQLTDIAGNPRRIKKFVNQLKLAWDIVQAQSKNASTADSASQVTIEGLFEWMLLQHTSLALWEWLASQDIQQQANEFIQIQDTFKHSKMAKKVAKIEALADKGLNLPVNHVCWKLLKETSHINPEHISVYLKLGNQSGLIVPQESRPLNVRTPFGDLIEKLRKDRKLSRVDMASQITEETGHSLSDMTIMCWERRGNHPRVGRLDDIQSGLKLTDAEMDALLSAWNNRSSVDFADE